MLRWVGSVEVGVALIWTYRLLALLKVEAARAWCRHVRQTCCSAWWRMVRIERAAKGRRGREEQDSVSDYLSYRHGMVRDVWARLLELLNLPRELCQSLPDMERGVCRPTSLDELPISVSALMMEVERDLDDPILSRLTLHTPLYTYSTAY